MADYNSSYTGQQIDNAVGAGLAVRGVSGIVKSDGSGNISAATLGTDYQAPTLGDGITTTTSWSGSGPYTQTVTLDTNIPTSNSKIDIQPDAATIAQLISDGVQGLYIANSSGTLTAYAVGAAPTAALTLQVTVTEVTT